MILRRRSDNDTSKFPFLRMKAFDRKIILRRVFMVFYPKITKMATPYGGAK